MDSERDWTSDFSHENGNYYCRCLYCQEQFRGHKRRVVCRACADALHRMVVAPREEVR